MDQRTSPLLLPWEGALTAVMNEMSSPSHSVEVCKQLQDLGIVMVNQLDCYASHVREGTNLSLSQI